MSTFDTILIVDWSGGNDRGITPVKDAIWAGVVRDGVAQDPTYLRNRQVAENWLEAFLQAERDADRRVFVGFDFPFGYPGGFAKALTGKADPFAVWDWFKAHIEDAPKSNNRFDIAGQINSRFSGHGPFWANGLARDIAHLPRNKQNYQNPFPEKRSCETRAKGAFTCWQMAGAGAVGSQVFMGLPVLARLRDRFAGQVSVWPFEPTTTPIAFVEVWPSLTLGKAPEGIIKDAWQVTEIAKQIASLPANRLAELLKVKAPEEGWIFGLGFEDELRGTAPPLRNDCFALPAGVDWTPVDAALELLKQRMSPIADTEALPLSQALSRFSAADVKALRHNPPLPNTAVDGYGFAGGKLEGLHTLPLMAERATAGDAPAHVPDGHAIRILTGAALPDGVDTVVLQEDVRVQDGNIRFHGPVKHRANTRNAGEDVQAGDLILRAKMRVTPAHLALLAATGVDRISVHKPLRVGVLSTGDELVEVGQDAKPGQIFDANRPMLLGLMRQLGFAPVDLGKAPDSRTALRRVLDDATAKVDAILTSGGASAGDEDHMAALLNDTGAMALWRIAIKPGRPLALGVWGGVPVFGLPGNPVAAKVCTLIFALPALRVLAGGNWQTPQGFMVPAAFSKTKKAGRREFLRARISDGKAEVFTSEGSGRISGLSWADGLVELGDAAQTIIPGDPVRYIPYSSFNL